MKWDVTTFTRYFAILIIVFVMWLYLINHGRVQTFIREIFETEHSSLMIK